MFDYTTLAAISPGINEFTIAVNADDFTVVRAVRTNDFAGYEFHLCHIEAERFLDSATQCKDCSSVAAHQMAIIIHDDFFSKGVCKGFYNTLIFTYTTLKYDRRKDFFAFSDIV